MRTTIDVDSIFLLIDADACGANMVAAVIEEAIRFLAHRMAAEANGVHGMSNGSMHLESMDIAMSLDELLSGRGSQRLADELHDRMMRRIQWT